MIISEQNIYKLNNNVCPGLSGVNMGTLIAQVLATYGVGKVICVDAQDGANQGDGDNWDEPYLTITYALTKASSHDIILLKGDFTESVVTPNKTGANHLTFMGVGSMVEKGEATEEDMSWTAAASNESALTVDGLGCKLLNLRFIPQTGAACVKLNRDGSNKNATSALIKGCYFWGNGLYAIDFVGAPSEITIRDNVFSFQNTTNGAAIGSSGVGVAYPYEVIIENNIFRENKYHINMYANSCVFRNNVFQGTGHVITTTYGLRIIGGNDNMVMGNWFGGTYSQAGGYKAGTGDEWHGNMSKSVGLAEVSASGFTIDVPGA